MEYTDNTQGFDEWERCAPEWPDVPDLTGPAPSEEEWEEVREEDGEEEDWRVIDALIRYLSSLPRHRAHLINPSRQAEFMHLQQLLETRDEEWTMSVNLRYDEGYGSISLEADSFEFDKELLRGLQLADNLEVLPLLNGKLRLSVMFYRLTIGFGGYI